MNLETFLQAIQDGDISTVQALLEQFPYFANVRNPYSATDEKKWDEVFPLTIAAKYGHEELVRLLVASGAEVYSNAMNTYPAVIVADWEGHTAIRDYFLHEIPHLADGTRGVGIAINLAGRQGWIELVRKHLEIDPLAVHQRGWIGDSPLHWPAHNGYTEIVALLLEHGADPNAHEISWIGGTPLHWASERHADILEMLFAAGADPNARVQKEDSSYLGATALHWCANQPEDCAECAETLLRHGTDPHTLDAKGRSALSYAEEGSHPRVAEVLRLAN